MAGSSTSNKARGRKLGSELHTTDGTRSSRPFVSDGLCMGLSVVVSGSSHSNDTRMPTTRLAHNGPKPCELQAKWLWRRLQAALWCILLSAPLEIAHLRPSEPNAPNNHHHHATTPATPPRFIMVAISLECRASRITMRGSPARGRRE